MDDILILTHNINEINILQIPSKTIQFLTLLMN